VGVGISIGIAVIIKKWGISEVKVEPKDGTGSRVVCSSASRTCVRKKVAHLSGRKYELWVQS
jgi:hypothetical protein